MRLVNTVTPYLRVYNPATGEFRRFEGGVLDIEEGDPDYEAVMAEARRNPSISIHASLISCPECGNGYEGKAAKASLAAHRKQVHFDAWLRDKDAADAVAREQEVKSRAGYACDVCQPVQEFGTPEDLAAHVTLVHANRPDLDAEGNTVAGEDGGRRPAASTEIPAASSPEPG